MSRDIIVPIIHLTETRTQSIPKTGLYLRNSWLISVCNARLHRLLHSVSFRSVWSFHWTVESTRRILCSQQAVLQYSARPFYPADTLRTLTGSERISCQTCSPDFVSENLNGKNLGGIKDSPSSLSALVFQRHQLQNRQATSQCLIFSTCTEDPWLSILNLKAADSKG